MLTLKMLRDQVQIPPEGEKIPTWKELREGGYAVCARMKAGRDAAEIIVYENGYVLYHIGSRYTVFPINLETSYSYSSSSDNGGEVWKDRDIPQTYFDNEEWYLLLILVGEDRLQENMAAGDRRRMKAREKQYGEEAYIGREQNYHSSELEKNLILEEQILCLLETLTARQRVVVEHVYWDEMTQWEIAKETGVKSQGAVSDMLERALSRMRERVKRDSNGKN